MSTRFKTAHAEFTSPDAVDNARRAAAAIAAELAPSTPALVIFFSALNYAPDAIAAAMQAAFPASITLGCTSSGEAAGGEMLQNSVVAMAFSSDVFDHCQLAVVPRNDPADAASLEFASVDAAMRSISQSVAPTPLDLNYREYVGFILSSSENTFTERVLERVGELTNVTFVGGVAGYDGKTSSQSRVFLRGKAYPDACLLGLWKPVHGFSFLKTQAADVLNRTFTVTKAGGNVIHEFDGSPAAEVYAEAIGFSLARLKDTTFDQLSAHPLAFNIDGEPFLRPVLGIVDGTGLLMTAIAKEGQRFSLTRKGDLVCTTRAAVEGKLAELSGEGTPAAAILHINCVLRCMILDQEGGTADFASIFSCVPSLSFASYGEVYVGLIAITSTMVIFK